MKIASTFEKGLLIARLCCKAVRSNLMVSRNPFKALLSAGRMLRESCIDQHYGHFLHCRRVDGRYYWHPHLPGYPSVAFDRFFRRWIYNSLGRLNDPHLFAAYVVITGNCPLNCEHCFEHETVACKETRRAEDVLRSIEQVIKLGAIRISLTGGEPITRLPLIHRILKKYQDHGIQFWINTSATGLTTERIRTLKKLGLTGITFSLDHHDERAHDRFRGYEGCYRQVIAAVRSAVRFGLVTELSLCATNEFITAENLETYLQLATGLGVTFVQTIEPRSLGKYTGRDVALKPDKRKRLEDFCLSAVSSRTGRAGPLITYPDFHNRRYGCDGGKYHLYVDIAGHAFPCPFCRTISTPLNRLTRDTLSQILHCPHTTALQA